MGNDLAQAEGSYCAEMSQATAEPLYGTAVNARVWFLLEVNQSWSAQATSDNQLPRPVQRWLEEQLAAGPQRRLQFIRQSGKTRPEGLAFYVALTDEMAPALYRFHLPDYDALLDLDVAAVIRQESEFQPYLQTSPLFLVCTHGKRDRCCARFGNAFYQALSVQSGPAAWQTTHLGGHRFAATALLLPQGINYGWLTEADIPQLLASQRRDEVYLERLRGRTCYDPLVQTADYLLRQRTGQPSLDAFRFVDSQPVGELAWVVTFATPVGETHSVHLVQTGRPLSMTASCMPAKVKSRFTYHWVDDR